MTNNLRSFAALRTHRSSTGFRGVHFDRTKNRFEAEIGNHKKENRVRKKGFKTAVDAARAYDEMARKRYGKHACLNFPNEGELCALPSVSTPGFCNVGHDLTIYGYISPAGTINCRQCNAWAAFRYKKRLRAKTAQR